jgi:opacity protein-like surface antigen
MLHQIIVRRRRLAAATALLTLVTARGAQAQGFISPSLGYNFGGSAGCLTATDCRDRNWNWGGSLGTLGSVVGFEAELTYEGEFTGDSPNQASSVTTLMGNFMLAPRISIVQPFGVIGIGVIKTKLEDRIVGSSNSENDIGWTLGGGLIVYVQKHVGLKGDVRYYRSFSALDVLGFEFGSDRNRINFGRAGFGVVLKF